MPGEPADHAAFIDRQRTRRWSHLAPRPTPSNRHRSTDFPPRRPKSPPLSDFVSPCFFNSNEKTPTHSAQSRSIATITTKPWHITWHIKGKPNAGAHQSVTRGVDSIIARGPKQPHPPVPYLTPTDSSQKNAIAYNGSGVFSNHALFRAGTCVL